MASMVRKQIYITPEQDEYLKQRAARSGETEAEIVRKLLDDVRQREDEREAARLAAWERAKAMMEERGRMKVPQRERTWTREDLYERDDRG